MSDSSCRPTAIEEPPLEEVVAMFPRVETGGFPRETGEAGNAEVEEGNQKRPNSGKPETGFCFPGFDTGDEVGGGVDLGVKVEEGGKVGPKLGDASQVADPGGDALVDEGKSGPAG